MRGLQPAGAFRGGRERKGKRKDGGKEAGAEGETAAWELEGKQVCLLVFVFFISDKTRCLSEILTFVHLLYVYARLDMAVV